MDRSASRVDGFLGGVLRGDALINGLYRLREDFLVDDFFLHHLRQAFNFGVPAINLRLVAADLGLGLGDLGLRVLHALLGNDDELLVQLDLLHRLIVRLLQLGDENRGQHLAAFDLVADVDGIIFYVAGYFGKQRGLVEGVDEAGLFDGKVDGPSLRPHYLDRGLGRLGFLLGRFVAAAGDHKGCRQNHSGKRKSTHHSIPCPYGPSCGSGPPWMALRSCHCGS